MESIVVSGRVEIQAQVLLTTPYTAPLSYTCGSGLGIHEVLGLIPSATKTQQNDQGW